MVCLDSIKIIGLVSGLSYELMTPNHEFESRNNEILTTLRPQPVYLLAVHEKIYPSSNLFCRTGRIKEPLYELGIVEIAIKI